MDTTAKLIRSQAIGRSLPDPILVTGTPRSGTSMTAGILRRCGAWCGKVDGSFENTDIRDSVMTPWFDLLGADPRCQRPLPNIETMDSHPLAGLARRMEMFAKFQGYRHGPWFYKSPRIAATWPAWWSVFPETKWVIVRRGDKDIINSCMKTGYMDAYDTPEEWQCWLDVWKELFDSIYDAKVQVREVWPHHFVAGDYTEIQGVVEWLGLRWEDGKVKAFINPELWRDYDGK